jgi:hypothetical protein
MAKAKKTARREYTRDDIRALKTHRSSTASREDLEADEAVRASLQNKASQLGIGLGHQRGGRSRPP